MSKERWGQQNENKETERVRDAEMTALATEAAATSVTTLAAATTATVAAYHI